MRELLDFYQRNYFRLLAGMALVAFLVLAFLLGFAKGSPKSISELSADLSRDISSVLTAAWTQSLDPEPVHFLQPARRPGTGVTVNTRAGPDDLVLLTGFFDGDPGLRLVRRDGTVVAHWPARVHDLLPEQRRRANFPKTNWNIDLHGAFVEPDGSVLFNLEYQGLVKMSRCGAVEWTLPERTHHTLEPAAAGGYWVGGRAVSRQPDDSAFYPIASPRRSRGRIEDDLILRVGPDGRIVTSKSLFEILMENGFEPLLTATGESIGSASLNDGEVLHLNKITELGADLAPAFPGFAAGDLAVSIRDFNLVIVVDPQTWKVKWHSTGPWIRQHSVRFMSDGTISVFNNNAYDFQSGPDGVTDLSQPRVTNILAVEPLTGRERILYGGRPGQEMLSVFRGYHHEMPGGGLMITEPEAGRAFEVDRTGRTVWEFVNRYDETRVIEMTSARAFPLDYFTVKDWSCP